MSTRSSSFYIDVYNRKRDSSTGRAILNPYTRTTPPFFGGNALCIAEMSDTWRYRIPGLEIPASGKDSSGREIPSHYFITTPNMPFIPETFRDPHHVRVRTDGRYAESDFTINPQFFFEGTYYLPYVHKKPTENLESHPYRLIWYDLQPADFVLEEGSLVSNLGRIKPELAQEFIDLRKGLSAKIKELEISTRFTGIELAELRYANEAMLFASVILTSAAQAFNNTLLHVTGFQRHFLEALACYEYLTIYRDRPLLPDGEPYPVESHLIGCFTPHLDLVEKLYRKGIPVWLVRTPAQLPGDINISCNTLLIRAQMKLEYMAESQVIFSGHASAVRNRACQALKLGNIRLGHSAYIPHAGDFNMQYIPDSTVYQPYSKPLGPGQSGPSTSSSAISSSMSGPSSSPAIPSFTSGPSTSSFSTISYTSGPFASSSSTTTSPMPSSTSMSTSTPTSQELLVSPPALQKITNTFCVNSDKFFLKTTSHAPLSINAWASALRGVNRDTSRVWDHANILSLRGYAFLDPHVFISRGLEGRGKIYFFAWLSIRSAWLTASSNVDDSHTHPGGQDWKDYLCFQVGASLGFFVQQQGRPPLTGEAPKNKRRRVTAATGFNLDLSNVNSDIPIKWNGVTLTRGGNVDNLNVPVPPKVLSQVIWDLFEHNFNFELLALDRAIHPRKYMTDHAALHRDTLVAACVPNGSLVRNDLPTVEEGLGATSWVDRWEYVEALRVLMLTWPGSGSRSLANMRLTAPHNGDESVCAARCKELERIAFPFYCQSFFDYFGRAATTPHQLPL